MENVIFVIPIMVGKNYNYNQLDAAMSVTHTAYKTLP